MAKTIVAGPGVNSQAIAIPVDQTAHGFTVGQIVYHSGAASTWALAQADSEATLAHGVVLEVTTVDRFIVLFSGLLPFVGAHAFGAAGAVLYLDPDTAGASTTTKPTAPDLIQIVAVIDTANDLIVSIQDAVEEVGAVNVFGSDYQRTESMTREVTANTTPTAHTASTLTTPSLTGDYVVRWSAIVDRTSGSQDVVANLYEDASALGADIIILPGSSTGRISVGGSFQLTFTSETRTYDIRYNRTGGSGDAGCGDVVVEFWRVS